MIRSGFAIVLSVPLVLGALAAEAAEKTLPAISGGKDIPQLLVNPVPAETMLPTVSAAPVKKVVVGVPNDIFSTFADGQPVGVIAETVDYVFKKMGYFTQYRNMPKKVMRIAVHDGKLEVGTSLLKFPHREKLARYSDPIVTEYSVLVVRKGAKFDAHETADLRGKRLGGREGFHYPLIDDDSSIRIERNRTDGENIRRLLLGKIDAAIVGAVSDIFDLRAEGVMTELEILDRAVGSVNLSAALADERFSEADIEDFNRHLAVLKKSDDWTRILERNAVADLVKEWPFIEKSKSSSWFW